jgi:predicted Zn-dependent peptidase
MRAQDQDTTRQPDAQRLTCGGVATLLRHNPAHEAVSVRLYARGGASSLQVSQAGSDVLYARTARRGTHRFAKQQLNAALASMATDVGASVGEDATVFQMKCLRRHFEPAWELFADFVLHPLLEESEVELVRRQMLVRIRQRSDDADGRLADMAREHAYAGHPYASHPEGTEGSVAALDAEVARAHMRRQLRRSNMLLVVAGQIDAEALQGVAPAAFESLANGDGPAAPVSALRFEGARLRVEERQLPTNYILGQFAAPGIGDEAYPATLLAMSVLRDRLFEEIRTKRNLSYAPGAGLGNHVANLGWIYVTAVDPVITMRVMLDEMRRLRDVPLQAKELRDKVEVYITRYHLQNETSQAQARFLASYELFGGGWERSREFVSRLEALTPDDVRRAARDVLHDVQYSYLGVPSAADESIFVDP